MAFRRLASSKSFTKWSLRYETAEFKVHGSTSKLSMDIDYILNTVPFVVIYNVAVMISDHTQSD